MIRLLLALFIASFALSACDVATNLGERNDGTFRIGKDDTAKIQYRMLDSINALRQTSGLTKVELSSELTAAAATHSRDMSVQNRPWHFGSDGSSPIQRVARTGYTGRMLGENISETFENDIQTLADWMENPETRDVIMDPDARYMGFSWFQEPGGKIWWTLVVGGETGVGKQGDIPTG